MKQTINFGDKPSDHARQIQAYQVLGISYFGNEHTASPMNEAWMIWMGARMGTRLNGWMAQGSFFFKPGPGGEMFREGLFFWSESRV